MKFKIKFEIFNKKMITVIDAETQEQAQRKLHDKLIIHEIEPIIQEDETLKNIKNIFGI